MSIRVHAPETDRLSISGGDWLLVKRYLTAGEYQELMRASVRPMKVEQPGGRATPELELDPIAAGLAQVMAYLLDWSFQQADGSPLIIAGQSPAMLRAALHAIDAEAYMEIQRAIQRHQQDTADRVEREKKTHSSPTDSPLTLTCAAP